MSLARYNKYKPSEIDWFGDIPDYWEVKRVKDLTSIISKGTTPSTEGKPYTNVGVRFIKAENIIENGQVSDTPQFYISEETNNLLNRSKLKSNDLLLVIAGATTGKIAILKELQLPANTNQAVCFLRLRCSEKQNSLLFKYYFLNSKYFQDLIWLYAVTSAQPNLPMAILSRFSVYYPPLSEQTTIASFLDQKTSAIDRKVSLLEQKISHYQQLRKSLINETVCRGLDKNVKLKESGIEWIGMIPTHWKSLRLKDIGYLYSGLSGKSGNDFNQEENPNNKLFIPFTNIFNNHIINPLQLGTVVVGPSESQNNVKANDLFFLMSSEDYDGLGKTAILDQELNETYLNSFCKGFRITKNYISPSFLNYLLNSFVYRNILKIEGKGFTRMNLKMEKVSDLQICFPDSISEQTAIATFLDEKTQKIDLITTNISNQIATLKELRKTLINDVVTGKLKVTV